MKHASVDPAKEAQGLYYLLKDSIGITEDQGSVKEQGLPDVLSYVHLIESLSRQRAQTGSSSL